MHRNSGADMSKLDKIDIDWDREVVDPEEITRWLKEQHRKQKLREDNPWVRDIIRALWDTDTFLFFDTLVRRVREFREAAGLPIPEALNETVQSTLNAHTSQSAIWKKNGAKLEDDLFYSPKGKHSGTWALRSCERAVQWLKERGFPPT
jgi:hypothetical protein